MSTMTSEEWIRDLTRDLTLVLEERLAALPSSIDVDEIAWCTAAAHAAVILATSIRRHTHYRAHNRAFQTKHINVFTDSIAKETRYILSQLDATQ